MTSQQPRFTPGDHLHVRRRAGYMHHGVYISDERVIQFGGRILDKPDATIGVASLEEFERGGVAQVVVHGGPGRFFQPLPDLLTSAEIIERAEWLLKNYEPGRYNLIGNNCEHMANWSVTGWYAESHQARKLFLALAGVGAAGMFYDGYRKRISAAPTKLLRWIFGLVMFNAVLVTMYNVHIRRFWRDIGYRYDREKREIRNDDYSSVSAVREYRGVRQRTRANVFLKTLRGANRTGTFRPARSSQ